VDIPLEFTAILFREPVGNAWARDPVNQPLRIAGRIPHKSGWMKMSHPLPQSPGSAGQLPEEAGHRAGSRHTGAAIELFPVKVVDGDSMSGFTERGCSLIRYNVVEGARGWMGEDDGDLHGPSHFLATALKNV
jgi:hypothetical protein